MNPSVPNVATLPGRALRARAGAQVRRVALRVKFDPFRIFLFVLTVMTISRIHQHFKPIAVVRPALLMTAMAGLYAYLNPRIRVQ